jgi:pimeloyl-ACP methyl ester carboxylesterase
MAEAATTQTQARPTVSRALWAGWSASVPVVLLATITVLAVPHQRGIGFFPTLRYAVVTLACLLLAAAAALVYRVLIERVARPRTILAAGLFGVALLVLLPLDTPGLRAAAIPVVLVVAAALTWLVPRFLEHPGRSRLRTTLLALLGALELIGVIAALASERVAPPAVSGLAFDIPRALFDVEHKQLTLPSGARIHYVDEGTGDTVLFLHGNPSWSFQWRDLIHNLRGQYRCVALDYPGFGLSDASPGFGFTPREESHVVEEFVDQLGLRNVTLVMQDWGGPIGLGLAGRRPELIRGVILGVTWTSPTSTGEPRGKFSLIAGGPIGEFAQVNFNGFASVGIDSGIVRELSAAEKAVYLHPFRPLDRRGIAAFYPGQILAARDYFVEVEAGLPRLSDKPALIFWALQDPGMTARDRAQLEAAFPTHKTIELPNASHFFFEDALAEMLPEIHAFMPAAASGRAAAHR